MHTYELTMEDGIITGIDTMDNNGNPIAGILYVPKEATGFSADAWVAIDASVEGIVVDKHNPVYSSAYNCLLSKDGKKLVKTCKDSDLSKLTGLTAIGRDAFSILLWEPETFVFRIPEGVQTIDYRAFAITAEHVEITVPASVVHVDLLAFMIRSRRTHIIFEGDPHLRIGVFGTAAEARDSGFEVYRSMPAILYPKAENITVTCQENGKVSAYCKEYHIKEVG